MPSNDVNRLVPFPPAVLRGSRPSAREQALAARLVCAVLWWHKGWARPAYQIHVAFFVGHIHGISGASVGACHDVVFTSTTPTSQSGNRKKRGILEGPRHALRIMSSTGTGQVGSRGLPLVRECLFNSRWRLSSARLKHPGFAGKMCAGLLKFLEQGISGRIGASGLAALRKRQHELDVSLSLSL